MTARFAMDWAKLGWVRILSLALDLIGGRWKAVIIYHLQGEPQRFNQLQRLLPGVTAAVLSRRLRQLEADGLLAWGNEVVRERGRGVD